MLKFTFATGISISVISLRHSVLDIRQTRRRDSLSIVSAVLHSYLRQCLTACRHLYFPGGRKANWKTKSTANSEWYTVKWSFRSSCLYRRC